jgi:hypothetical protein
MPSLTINGHSVTVDDSFDKLSPEEQNATVDHIAKELHDGEKPSGIGAGLAQGVSDVASGVASTLGLGGVKSDALDKVAAVTAPKDYKAAPLIREGGHFYNPSDWNPGNIPQAIAQMAPGLATDLVAGKGGAMAGKAVAGPRGAMIGGAGAALASLAARTFGPGAHENADARTGVPNSEPNSADIIREGGKQVIAAPFNAIGATRLIPGLSGKVAEVGAKGAGNALAKYLSTIGIEGGVGAASDAVNQVGTTIGTDKGIQYDPNKTAEAAVTRAAGGGLLAAPRLAGDVHSSAKFRQFGGDNAEAATALANRQIEAADGKKLVGPLGGTKTAAQAVAAAHADVHNELAAASKGEDLSTDNANTLKRINEGGTASNSELTALASEASPDTVHLARQAMLSAKLKKMGTITDDKFTGGLSGAMEKLRPIANPTGTVAALGATALAGHAGSLGMLGTFAPQAVGAIAGAYGGARMLDKLTGARSPAQGFTDKFADANVPVRAPAAVPAQPAPVSTSVPQIAPPQNTQLWGTPAPAVPSLRATLNTNAKLSTGMAQLVKQVAKESAAKNSALEAANAPPAPEAPQISPIALKMMQARMKAGLPEAPQVADVPTVAPPAPPVDAFDALKPLMGRQRAVMRGLSAASKQQAIDNIAQRKAAGVAQAEGLAGDSHLINDNGGLEALSNPEFTKRGSQLISAANVMRKLTAQPAEEASVPTGTPASPLIAEVMAKISKKNGKVNETPHPEEMQPYNPIPEEALVRKSMNDDQVAAHQDTRYRPEARTPYGDKVIETRRAKREPLLGIANDHPEDGAAVESLYHQLDHTSRRAVARKALAHYTNFMSPAAAKAVHSHFTRSVLENLWSKE